MTNPRTVNEMMVMAAEALTNRDFEALDEISGVVRGWMQDGTSTSAQLTLLAAMMDAAHELLELE